MVEGVISLGDFLSTVGITGVVSLGDNLSIFYMRSIYRI